MSNKYLRKTLIPSATIAADIYEVPAANTGIIKSLRVTNGGVARSSIFVSQYTAGSSVEHLLTNGFVLPIGASFDLFNGVSCVLEAGDKLTVKSSQADVTFYLSYLEVDRT
jgi:hypothetical protein